MGKASLLVLPSYIDNSPNVVSEAIVAGVPVVATRVGGIPWMIEDGVIGILNDRNLRKNLGKAGRLEATKRFYPETVAQRVIEACEHILTSC